MQKNIKLGAATLTLVALISGCAPAVGPNQQAGATGDAYGTTGGTTTGTATGGTGTGYDTYGSTSGTGTTGNYYDYSAPGSSTSGGSYSGGSSYSTGSSGSASGSHAVQVVASPNRNTADAMQRQMQSMGFTAVVDQVGGYYKVRIPFTTADEAKSALSRVRGSVPDAFYTVR